MIKAVACILCCGTDYARECAAGQCRAEQLELVGVDLPKRCGECGWSTVAHHPDCPARRLNAG